MRPDNNKWTIVTYLWNSDRMRFDKSKDTVKTYCPNIEAPKGGKIESVSVYPNMHQICVWAVRA